MEGFGGQVQGLNQNTKISLQISIDEIDNGYLLSWWDKDGCYHRAYREELHQIAEFIKTLDK